MSLVISDIDDTELSGLLDIGASGAQLASIASLARSIGVPLADQKLRCFAGMGLVDSPSHLSARQASSFILLLQTLADAA